MATRDELQRLHDNELPADEAERLRGRLTDEDRARLQAMDEVGQAVRSHLVAQANAQTLDVWAAIEGRLDDAPAKVIPLHQRRWVRVTAAVAAACAAAVAALWIYLSPGPAGAPNIESVDFGDEAGMLFQLHDSKTTVIWQNHQEEQPE